MKSVNKITGLGEVLWDLYPDEKHLGGAPANVAIHAHRLGAQGFVASAVGHDSLGDAIIGALKKQGLSTFAIQRCRTHPTGTVRVRLDDNGIPYFRCSRDTAFDHIHWNGELEKLAHEADAVVVGTLAQRNSTSRRTVLRFLAETIGIVVFDVNFREWNETTGRTVLETLIHTDILKLNENELHQMKSAFRKNKLGLVPFLDWLIKNHRLKLIALSLGAKGCLLSDGSAHMLSPGIIVEPVDTTGCGDGFVAGLIVKYLEHASLEDTAEFANYLGAFLATRKGAAPVYALHDVEEFRTTHSDRTDIQL
jgi:fructokinase